MRISSPRANRRANRDESDFPGSLFSIRRSWGVVMSLRGMFFARWRPPVRGDCFAESTLSLSKCSQRHAAKVNALRELQAATGQELSARMPTIHQQKV
jgi:hypothetical protein